MNLKSLFKRKKDKKTQEIPPAPGNQPAEDVIQHEISFDKMETRLETRDTVAEIDIYVNNEKTNIHSLATETRLGRDPSQSDIIISELIVSKLHCTIYSRENHYFVRDEDSTNGIYIDNEKITERAIKNGDIILLGKKGTVKIIFHQR
ncbi:MAG: FHA domain-containing protein [bacterium]|nr:FHA domain-containing protein [bacterium]